MSWEWIHLPENKELDGNLVYMEAMKEIPFEIKRLFYIFNTPEGAVRANHANKSTDFVLINVSGSTKVELKDGQINNVFHLSSPNKGLYVYKMTWMRTFDFSKDSVLLVVASEPYDSTQYIENYDEFLEEVERQSP